MASPTAMSMELLRRRGYLVSRVESWVPVAGARGGGVRRDAFGIADLLACHPHEREVVLVQATALSCVSARVAKIRSKPDVGKLLQSGIKVEVWGWGKRAGRWHPKIVAIEPGDLRPVVVEKIPRRPRRVEQAELF
jgi:hypothetical protein